MLPARLSHFIISLFPTIRIAYSKMPLFWHSALTRSRRVATTMPDRRQCLKHQSNYEKKPERRPLGLTGLPNEILDDIFAFVYDADLSPSKKHLLPFLMNRATHSSALRAVWGHIDLGITSYKMPGGHKTEVLAPRHTKLKKYLGGSTRNFELVGRMSVYVSVFSRL
jgi:hypothetical protein